MSSYTETGLRTDRKAISGPWQFIIILLGTVLQSTLFLKMGLSGLILAVLVPVAMLAMTALYFYPKIGIYVAVIMSYAIPLLGRYTPTDIPFGLSTDIFLMLTYLVTLVKYWQYTNFRLAMNSITLVVLIWYGYLILQLINPEARSIAAWFYTMRAMGLYPALLIPLCFILFNTRKDWYNFLNLWLALSLFAILWSYKMNFIGLSATEQRWLDDGGHVTHLLFGKLRNFSFYTDAGTFGADMGRVTIMAGILMLGPFKRKWKVFYGVVAAMALYAMMLSGTRGALAVPAIGAISFIVMGRNTRLIVMGAIVLIGGFVFLKYTYIGHNNYQIYRMRSALNPEDASLQVRLLNRERLTTYLEGKPFGGGLGTTGVWGQRFSPNTWLANFPPDGLYTRIRAETGIVGKYLYLFVWLFILYKAMVTTWKMTDRKNQYFGMAIIAGYAGILMANYGNELMTQVPISITTYIFLAFIFSMKRWNSDGEPVMDDGSVPHEGSLKPDKPWHR